MNHEIEHARGGLPQAKEPTSSLSQNILDERIHAFKSSEAIPCRTSQESDDFVSIEIHVNKKALDAVGKSFSSAMSFFPNLVIEGQRGAEATLKQAHRGLTKSVSDATDSWNHAVTDVQRGFTDASIHTYKTINRGAEQIGSDANTALTGMETAAERTAKTVRDTAGGVAHGAMQFATRTTHDTAKAASQQLRQWSTWLDPDRPR